LAEQSGPEEPAADPAVLDLADPLRYEAEEAVRMAKLLLRSVPQLDIRLARALPKRDGETPSMSPRQCARLLHVLDRISDGNRLVPLVLHLVRHPDPRVRSKAALFLSRRLGNADWVNRLWAEKDARVRANAIEGIWNIDLPEVRHLLRYAVEDSAARVAGNAVYGLLLLKHPTAAALLDDMAGSPDPARVAAAAWVMGRTGDTQWVQTLQRLARAAAPNVRLSAIRSLVRLRRADTAGEGTDK
jgi:HEAT repeat protein